ncbi:reverse transcriptase domain-containing protein [Tanacetum coccineum]
MWCTKGILVTFISLILQECSMKLGKENDEVTNSQYFGNEKLLELANTPLNENCSAVILKKLPKKLGLLELISTQMTLELANREICTPVGIARDVFVPIGKFTFPADFIIVDYESDPRVPLILGRPFLWTARALIEVHGEEMILRDGDERLILNMKHDTSSYSNKPKK